VFELCRSNGDRLRRTHPRKKDPATPTALEISHPAALAGGATGGIIGALTQTGVSQEDAQVYAEGVRRGGSLVTVRVPERTGREWKRSSIAQQ